MQIPRIDFLIFGYRKITVEKKDLGALANIFITAGVSVKIEDSSFYVSERQFKKIETLISGKISYYVTEPRGLFGLILKYKRRFGVFAALFLSLFICFFTSTRIWDIRLDGASPEAEEEILEELSELGFSVGASFRKIDKAKIEAQMLLKSNKVSWININQRGTVAYVKVMPKLAYENEEKSGYANIVASRDCVIEEITVKKGVAVVKVGETVRRGQILISGVIPAELGGGFCYAEGEVIGRFSGEVSVSVSEKESEMRETEREIYKRNINFFDFSFNFLKKYGKSEAEYDIIKEKRRFLSFFGKKLPISRADEYIVFYERCELLYTRDEMIRLGSLRMRDALSSELSDKTLLKLKTSADFSEGCYTAVTEYVATMDVGKILEFDFLQTNIGD